MSSRLSTKPSRKDRPRSSDKLKAGRKRDGTPDKLVSPSQSQSQVEEDVTPTSKQVLDSPDIKALTIDPQELAKMRVPKPPTDGCKKQATTSMVMIRRLKSQTELDKPKLKQLLVAKPAAPDAPLKLDYAQGGARYDADGNIIAHSILGPVEDFMREAMSSCYSEQTKSEPIPIRLKTPLVKPRRKPKKQAAKPWEPYLNENNALRNWNLKMLERKKQQGYISKLLEKPVFSLVANKADDYRRTQEERYLIERTIPAVDYGQGYRIGSEFWSQQEIIGDDLSSIHMTLTKTEKGFPPPIEHIGHPQAVKTEMGNDFSRPNTPTKYPWHRSKYLKERRQQLNEAVQDLDTWRCEFDKLQIIGRNKPLANQELNPAVDELTKREKDRMNEDKLIIQSSPKPSIDEPGGSVSQEPAAVGPSLQFDSFSASWTGDSQCSDEAGGLVAHGARVTFEVFAGRRVTSHLNLVNNGCTTIYYDWKKLPRVNPFEGCAQPKVQRFYFNTGSHALLPGEGLEFPFVFKSSNAGIFWETWQLDTRPVLCGGAALRVTLHGVALQEDTHKEQREQIEKDLLAKQAKVTVQRILDELIDGIQTPERPGSPVDAYITQDKIFERNNLGMHYSHEMVSQLGQLYLDAFKEDEKPHHTWDLTIDDMKKEFLAVEDSAKREDLLLQMNNAVSSLYFPPFTPVQQQMYRVGYQLLLETADNIVTQSSVIREHLGMAMKDVAMPDTDQILQANENLRGEIKKKKKEHKEEEAKKDSKKENKKGKKEEKDKDRPKSKGSKTKTRTAASPPAAREHKRGSDKKRVSTPVRSLTPPSETGDPVLDAKYRSKMYLQVYDLLSSAVVKMTELFEDIREVQSGQTDV